MMIVRHAITQHQDWRHRLAVLCGLWLSLLLAATPAHAQAILTVTTTADSGPGSLRQALTLAESCDTITFDLPNPSVITLSSELVIATDLKIQGPGVAALTISGNNATRVFFINPGAAGATSGPPATALTVTIADLTIANGKAKGSDGGTLALPAVALVVALPAWGARSLSTIVT